MNSRTDILVAMKERLFEKGWTKQAYGDSDGPNCIVGALRQTWSVLNPGEWETGVVTLLEDIAGGCLESFNDQEDTKFDDIVDLIDLAIKKLEAEC